MKDPHEIISREQAITEAMERIELAGALELAVRMMHDRDDEMERALENLQRAGARVREARARVLEAVALVEDACRLMAR